MPMRCFRERASGVLALAFALSAVSAASAAAAPVYPDLVADSPGVPSLEVYADGSGARLLMRFDGFVHNRGPGALEIRAADRFGAAMTTVNQRVFDSGGGYQDLVNTPAPQVLYETDDDHDHWHLKHIARYSLWNSAGTAEVAPAQKVGFCLVDSEQVQGSAPRAYTESANGFCRQGEPSATDVTMGVSAGWRDIYGRWLAFQWVDVSDVPPGSYRLRAEIDPDGTIREADDFNPAALGTVDAVVPGYVAQSFSHPAAQGPRQVNLVARRFGGPARAAQFKIVSPPQHGTLDKPVGQWFDGANVQYEPAAGATGPDSFQFVARDPDSNFPRNPPAAVAALEGASGTLVTIAGAPESLQTGASAQLRAVVENGSPNVTWTVDGVPGGSAAVGTISASGLYRSPEEVPAAGQVRVAARSASGGSGEAVIGIVKAPGLRPAPDVPGAAPKGASKRNPLSRLRFARHGRRLIVSLRSAEAGRVMVRARKKRRLIGRCSARVSAKRRMTCAIKLDRRIARAAFLCRLPRTSRLRLPEVSVSATLYVKGRKRAVRHGRVRY